MRATYLYGAGDVRVITAPDPKIQQPTDALVRVTRACVCGSDLHPYHSAPVSEEGASIGPRAHRRGRGGRPRGHHRRAGRLRDRAVRDLLRRVRVLPGRAADLLRQRRVLERPGPGTGGGQAEAVRVPLADGTLVAVPGVDRGHRREPAGLAC